MSPRANWFWAFLVLAASAWGLVGCATAPAPVQVEAVGQLARGPSVWSAPVHETTDFAAPQLVTSDDDDVIAGVTTEAPAETPEVVAKDGGLVMGGAR